MSSMTADLGLFTQCATAVLQQAEAELDRRGVTLETVDQWEQITYAEDLMIFTGEVLYKVECRAKDGSDWFQVKAVLNSNGTSVDIFLVTLEEGRQP